MRVYLNDIEMQEMGNGHRLNIVVSIITITVSTNHEISFSSPVGYIKNTLELIGTHLI